LITTTVQTVVLEVEELTLSERREPVSQDKVSMEVVLSTMRTPTEVLVVVVVPVELVVPEVRSLRRPVVLVELENLLL
jgi:hypothetical protein